MKLSFLSSLPASGAGIAKAGEVERGYVLLLQLQNTALYYRIRSNSDSYPGRCTCHLCRHCADRFRLLNRRIMTGPEPENHDGADSYAVSHCYPSLSRTACVLLRDVSRHSSH
jgi:hypothetical protein